MRKACEVTLSGGETVLVKEPGARDLGAFFRCLPALQRLSDAMDDVRQGQQPDDEPKLIIPKAISLTDEEMDQVINMLDRTVEGLPDGVKVGDLSMFDMLALFMALGQVMPQDFTPPLRVRPS